MENLKLVVLWSKKSFNYPVEYKYEINIHVFYNKFKNVYT